MRILNLHLWSLAFEECVRKGVVREVDVTYWVATDA